MICNPCKDQDHEQCPTKAWEDPNKPKTGLGEENNYIQRTGLCPCHHRNTK